LSKHKCVSDHCHSDGAAGAAIEEPERAEYRDESADAGERFCERSRHRTHYVCDRPRVPHQVRPELAIIRATGPACCSSTDGKVSRNKGNSIACRVSTEYFSVRSCESVRIRVPHVKRELHPACRADPITAAAA